MIQEERAHGMRVNAFSLEGENSIGTQMMGTKQDNQIQAGRVKWIDANPSGIGNCFPLNLANIIA